MARLTCPFYGQKGAQGATCKRLERCIITPWKRCTSLPRWKIVRSFFVPTTSPFEQWTNKVQPALYESAEVIERQECSRAECSPFANYLWNCSSSAFCHIRISLSLSRYLKYLNAESSFSKAWILKTTYFCESNYLQCGCEIYCWTSIELN